MDRNDIRDFMLFVAGFCLFAGAGGVTMVLIMWFAMRLGVPV